MGDSGQRRPSRSPRSQRSRSADVDCLKKYTERRVEERRYTEISDSTKLDTSRWMPLPKNISRGQQLAGKRLSKDERQENVDVSAGSDGRWPLKSILSTLDDQSSRIEADVIYRQTTARSHSADVTPIKSDKRIIEERRHTDCSDPRIIATRWMQQVNGTKFRRESSPLARNECETTRTTSTRWMTIAKNPSPSPIPRINAERKSSITEHPQKDEGSRKDPDSSKWQPPRKFSPAKSDKGHLQRQDELDYGRDRSPSCIDTNEGASKLTQRMRDLYDFKTENEWPKRMGSFQQENVWISSSEEERNNYPRIRRNSQDLEFNDRIDAFKAQRESDQWRPKRSTHDEVFSDDQDDERLRKFNDKLRYSEDFGTGRARFRERRTYSDDYDERSKRASRLSRQQDSLTIKKMEENKRNSDVSWKSRDSRVSYAEIDFVKLNARTSDASYVSVSNISKKGSVECKSIKQSLEIPPRRAFSQTDERPATPVPPIEWNDELYVPKKLGSNHQERDSTRYKVYLT